MARILFETDPHFKELGPMANESRFSPKYSTRLDMMVKSFEWLYQQAQDLNIDYIVHGGDILDKPVILAKEGHAIKEAFGYNTTNIPEYVMVGNHDRKDNNTHALAILSNYPAVTIIDKPTKLNDSVSFLPFTLDIDGTDLDNISNKILFSHIDIIGTQYNSYITSTHGFDPLVLKKYFSMVLNGHIHTPSINGVVVNTGAFFGNGLGDSYATREPSAYLIDTDTMIVQALPNPYAIHYLTITGNDLIDVKNALEVLVKKVNPFYIRIQCLNEIKADIRQLLDSYMLKYPNILSGIVLGTTRMNKAYHSENSAQPSQSAIELLTDPIDILLSFIKTVTDDTLPASRKEVEAFIVSDYKVGTSK